MMDRKLLVICLLSLLGCFLISYPLLFNTRALPVVPTLDWLVFTGGYQVLFLSFLGVSALLLIFKKPSKSVFLLSTTLLFLLILALQDQIRWQPWFYIFGILLVFLLAYYFKQINTHSLADIFRIATIGVYIWSGIHKLNTAFVEDTLPNTFNLDLGLLGYSIPIFETLLGLGLVFQTTRKGSVIGLFGMHFFIFYHIIFGSISYDLVIVPWNIGMLSILILLFWHKDQFANQLKPWNLGKVAAGIVFLILPSLNFIGLWQSYPSFNLFSGKTTKAFLYVDDQFKDRFLANTQKKFDVENKISITKLSFSELKVPTPPDKQIYLEIFKAFCNDADHDLQVILEIKEMPHLFTNKWDKSSFFCSDLE